jgi:hypothetical protein
MRIPKEFTSNPFQLAEIHSAFAFNTRPQLQYSSNDCGSRLWNLCYQLILYLPLSVCTLLKHEGFSQCCIQCLRIQYCFFLRQYYLPIGYGCTPICSLFAGSTDAYNGGVCQCMLLQSIPSGTCYCIYMRRYTHGCTVLLAMCMGTCFLSIVYLVPNTR